jgi:fructokinase
MIVVAGECLVDLLLSPDGRLDPRPGGGPYNAARALARLGTPCAFLGRISGDRFGSLLREELRRDGVDLTYAIPTQAPTTLAVAELDGDGGASYRFYLRDTAAPGLRLDDVPALPEGLEWLHVGTLALALEPVATTLEVVAATVQPDALVMVDPNCRPGVVADRDAYTARIARLTALADVVKVSVEDLAYLAPGVDERIAARRLVSAGARVVLLTDGPRGVRIVTGAGEAVVPAVPALVVDTVGAGDAFGAAFLSHWSEHGLGRDELADLELLRAAAAFATRVASLTCERAGAMPPTRADLRLD